MSPECPLHPAFPRFWGPPHFHSCWLSGACSSFLPALMSLDTLVLAGWPCVPSLGLACHSGGGRTTARRGLVWERLRWLGCKSSRSLWNWRKRQARDGSHCTDHMAHSRPPASQASPLSHIVGTSGSLGHSYLSRGCDRILRLSPRPQVLLGDWVTVVVSVSPLLTHAALFPTQHPLPAPPPPPASLTWYLDDMWFTSAAYPPPPWPPLHALWGQGRQTMACGLC